MKSTFILLSLGFLFGYQVAPAQECGSIKSSSPATLVLLIRNSTANSTSTQCFFAAFDKLSSLPSEQSIPALVQLLGVKRALTPSEQEGAFFVRETPYNFYPAVKALFNIGESTQGAVVDYIVHDPAGDQVAWKNAVYLLNSLQHGEFLNAFTALKEKRKTLNDPKLISHVDAAIQELKRYCSSPSSQERCDAAAR